MSRIAMLTHSTNPRGGVVHALELGDALSRIGHEVTVHAPDPRGAGFFRSTSCRTVSIPGAPAPAPLPEMVARRVAEYVQYFQRGRCDFDVFHAQDSISGNALAALLARGSIAGFCRTVHHIDQFEDPRLTALQANAITAASRHFVVSRQWRARLEAEFGVTATIIGNGVDRNRYTAALDGTEAAVRGRLGVSGGPIFLSIGGVEPRKNSRRILAAFRQLRKDHPAAQLVIAGGASLLDHHEYQAAFASDLAAAALPRSAVVVTGPLPDNEMPSLYRIADALVFPSLTEGFGLAVLEAMASGLPVVTARAAPFTEYLGEEDAAWCDPYDEISIAAAMATAIEPSRRTALARRGKAIAALHDWQDVARAHCSVYAALAEREHA